MELRGMGASVGIVTGKVVFARDVREARRVQRGDILVTEMTSPEMMPALERAAGWVTALGGRTCHAAIVARELRKPAVVGVRDISMLANGVMVTVDGGAGVVTW